jgi:hypothetical protein
MEENKVVETYLIVSNDETNKVLQEHLRRVRRDIGVLWFAGILDAALTV